MHKIGIISDTHGFLREEVKEILKSCDVILHGGDITKQSILDELEKIAPVYAVRGNNDRDLDIKLKETIKIDVFGIKIFMIHNRKLLKEVPKDCQVIIYGHSHKYNEIKEHGQLWLNPGSCGHRRFFGAVTMAVIEVNDEGGFITKKIEILKETSQKIEIPEKQMDREQLVKNVIHDMQRGKTTEAIAQRNGISVEMAEQICRIYVTHPGIDMDGILNRMDLKRL